MKSFTHYKYAKRAKANKRANGVEKPKRGRPRKNPPAQRWFEIFDPDCYAVKTNEAKKSHMNGWNAFLEERNTTYSTEELFLWGKAIVLSGSDKQTLRNYIGTVRNYLTCTRVMTVDDLVLDWPQKWRMLLTMVRNQEPKRAAIITHKRWNLLTDATKNLLRFMFNTFIRVHTLENYSKEVDMVRRDESSCMVQFRAIKYMPADVTKCKEIMCTCYTVGTTIHRQMCLFCNDNALDLPDVSGRFFSELQINGISTHSVRRTLAAYILLCMQNKLLKINIKKTYAAFNWNIDMKCHLLRMYGKGAFKFRLSELPDLFGIIKVICT